MRYARALALSVVVSLLALSGCTDSPTGVLNAPTGQGLLGGLLGGGTSVAIAHRTTPLASDEVVTKTIGSGGGTLSLPKSGLTVSIPAGALSTPTTITVTAPAGDLVGYYFAPHGLQFAKSVRLTQQLSGTDIGLISRLLNPPVAVYFDGPVQPTVSALELLNLNISALLGVSTWDIRHFSAYAAGRTSGYVIATD
jgi:hypothetical protein